MPGLVRKILICAAVDGLLLQPANSNRSPGNGGVLIEYSTQKIGPVLKADSGGKSEILEAHGIIGLLNLVSTSYLISITKREQVAQIHGKAIYAIRDVTLIPLSSHAEARKAIAAAHKINKDSHPAETDAGDESDVGTDLETSTLGDGDEHPQRKPEDEAASLEPPQSAVKKSTAFVKNVVQDRGNYGRFAERWFSRGGGKANARRSQGMGEDEYEMQNRLTDEQRRQAAESLPQDEQEDEAKQASAQDDDKGGEAETARSDNKPENKKQSVIESLTPRILKGARLYFSSSGFYFSYEHNLSSSVEQQNEVTSTVPLHKKYDTLFFWNRHLTRPFIEAGQDSFVLPILLGFVGQRAFSIAQTEGAAKDVVAAAAQDPEEVIRAVVEEQPKSQAEDNQLPTSDFLLTLISRRSVRRAGLRYLRRGVDDDGNVANNVETEQILSPRSWSESEKTFSLTQVRGSIPLFFSQSPYSFKPIPVFFGSEATNQAAFEKHFSAISNRYGQVQVASLVDKHGTEVSIGEAYERQAKALNERGGAGGNKVGFEWFDFHSVCKGMNFKNVSILIDTLQDSLQSFGWLVTQDQKTDRRQTGVLRTNCMDCLDRTNVVQSAVAGWVLQQQLGELGLDIDLQTDEKTQWFNTLWADNGDAISKQYAGTSALKGDFTRTRKRHWTGALSDFSLTLNRYYNNIFGDYFLQTCIDYYLGNASPTIFDEFQTDMMAQDYALNMRHVRQNAIDTCIKIVLEDPSEELIAGWTLSCPRDTNTLRTLPFEECVLLLTDTALYFCRFDWGTEKVGSFERVELRDVTEIWRGAYITSSLGQTHLDESKNVGFALRYESHGPAMIRTNTRSLGNEGVDVAEAEAETEPDQTIDEQRQSGQSEDADSKNNEDGRRATGDTSPQISRLLAFKALPPRARAATHEGQDITTMSEVETTTKICHDIQQAAEKALARLSSETQDQREAPRVEQRDVISVADAKKSTGYAESIGYSLKRLVWS